MASSVKIVSMRYTSPSSITVVIILSLVGLVVGYHLMTRTVSPESDIPSVSSEAMMSIQKAHLPDHTLLGFKKTGVTDIQGTYKRVVVDNDTLRFSFEVPDEWLVELRNSGELPMNEEEMRSFFGDYWDFTEEDLAQKNMLDFLNILRETVAETPVGFPLMSVASSDGISYTDWNLFQTDFYLYPTEMTQRKILDSKKQEAEDFEDYSSRYSEEIAQALQTKWEESFVDGKSTTIAHEPLDVLENGEKVGVATKGRSGGEKVYINLGEKTLLIRKQGLMNELSENNFSHLIATLRFE